MPKRRSTRRAGTKRPASALYQHKALQADPLLQPSSGEPLCVEAAVINNPGDEALSAAATSLRLSTEANDQNPADTVSGHEMEQPALSADVDIPREPSDKRQESPVKEEAKESVTAGGEDILFDNPYNGISTTYPAGCNMHDPSQRNSEPMVTAADLYSGIKAESRAGQGNIEEAPTLDDGQQISNGTLDDNVVIFKDKDVVTPSASETSGTLGNPILIDDDGDDEVEAEVERGSVGSCRISSCQNKGKRSAEDQMVPWTDAATFYDNSDDPELLNDQWEAVQRRWFNIAFLKRLRNMAIRKNVLMFEELLLEASSKVAKEGELPEGCARDLMNTWVDVEKGSLVLVDRAALGLFRSQAWTAELQLCRCKRQRIQVKKFTKALKRFVAQEKVVEDLMEFLED
ncbi:hypothetical protein CC78DRAFT_588134 [Lojkania enalia]|uniref:Uncharacterized protein n=1 Tax=Lojkania enalia TaxID=147567 RepID=A0A9P4JXN3_9PLEO|nr:hypothetical protein CC78DRAFT_588134 [Didymosphaeria enalia]